MVKVEEDLQTAIYSLEKRLKGELGDKIETTTNKTVDIEQVEGLVQAAQVTLTDHYFELK
jgi:hypothetical protein